MNSKTKQLSIVLEIGNDGWLVLVHGRNEWVYYDMGRSGRYPKQGDLVIIAVGPFDRDIAFLPKE